MCYKADKNSLPDVKRGVFMRTFNGYLRRQFTVKFNPQK